MTTNWMNRFRILLPATFLAIGGVLVCCSTPAFGQQSQHLCQIIKCHLIKEPPKQHTNPATAPPKQHTSLVTEPPETPSNPALYYIEHNFSAILENPELIQLLLLLAPEEVELLLWSSIEEIRVLQQTNLENIEDPELIQLLESLSPAEVHLLLHSNIEEIRVLQESYLADIWVQDIWVGCNAKKWDQVGSVKGTKKSRMPGQDVWVPTPSCQEFLQ